MGEILMEMQNLQLWALVAIVLATAEGASHNNHYTLMHSGYICKGGEPQPQPEPAGSWAQVASGPGQGEWSWDNIDYPACQEKCNTLAGWGTEHEPSGCKFITMVGTKCHVHRYCTHRDPQSGAASGRRQIVTVSDDSTSNYVNRVVDEPVPTSTASCADLNSGIDALLSEKSHCVPARLSCAGKSHPYLHDGSTRSGMTTYSGTNNWIVWSRPKEMGSGALFTDYSANQDRQGTPLEMFAHNQRFCQSFMDGNQDGDGGDGSDHVGQYNSA